MPLSNFSGASTGKKMRLDGRRDFNQINGKMGTPSDLGKVDGVEAQQDVSSHL